MLDRNTMLDAISHGYYHFLEHLLFENEWYMAGMKEARNKFVANYYIYLCTKDLPKRWNDRRYSTDYVSQEAISFLKVGNVEGLCYEHIIPKKKYINAVCEERATMGVLTVDFIKNLLDQYLWTATITSEENKSLSQRKMPENWDNKSITARYEAAGIELRPHDKSYLFNPK